MDYLVYNIRSIEPFSSSDHNIVPANISISKPQSLCCLVRDYFKADREKMSQMAGDLIRIPAQGSTVDAQWNLFKRNLDYLREQCVPPARPSRSLWRPPWITRITMELMNVRRRAWDVSTSVTPPENYLVYKQLRNNCITSLRRDRFNHEKSLLTQLHAHPKRLFTYDNQRRRSPMVILDLNGPRGSLPRMTYGRRKFSLTNTLPYIPSLLPNSTTSLHRTSTGRLCYQWVWRLVQNPENERLQSCWPWPSPPNDCKVTHCQPCSICNLSLPSVTGRMYPSYGLGDGYHKTHLQRRRPIFSHKLPTHVSNFGICQDPRAHITWYLGCTLDH